ncbi:TPA: hypothetical protein ACF3PP_002414 [Enterococcus faecium]|uniref:hypothetical protein n=1 Tax=Enterococcus faecium TaxID=1352 RepID=UPI00032FF236|nr:hypothetical protein [Enterococcus faecium]EOL00984.1 hypothetical protein SIE_00493 [Enterococcus faecium EnGen0153]EOL63092.1 hypothetical protein UK3_02603 [Enterococcus faecium EnGen0305]QXJ65767.1 hypothetical protein J9543_02135 [Enterococcus faecium]
MRLREIQAIISENIPNLFDIASEEFYSGGTMYKKVKNFSVIRTSIINLLETGLFNNEKRAYSENDLLVAVSNDIMTFDTIHFKLFVTTTNLVIHKATAIQDLIVQNLHSESENSDALVVSLPNRQLTMEDFAELIILLKDTLKMLKILKEFQTESTIENFDVGSKWLILGFAGKFATQLFGNLLNIIQRNQTGIRQLDALDKQLESIGVETEIRNQVRETQLKANQAIYEQLTRQFLEANDLDTQAEVLSQMTKVTANIDHILSLGVGFEAAVTASNEVAKTFPSLEQQKLLDQAKVIDNLKQIPQTSPEDEIE